MPDLVLHNFEMDENCYRARLMLAALGLEYRPVAVNMFPGQEQKRLPMLAINPTGSMPVLTDGELVLSGTAAILLYLAKTYDAPGAFLPADARAFGEVVKWVGFSETMLAPAIDARLKSLFGTPGDEAALKAAARKAFRIMDDHMTARHFDGKEWFAGDGPTLADIALFPSFALSRDYGIDHDEFPALRRWTRRFRTLKGFRTMPGIPDYH
ncbi:MAG: gstc [Rhizobium sp.]|nr:gstc [Rhizobium sp.]